MPGVWINKAGYFHIVTTKNSGAQISIDTPASSVVAGDTYHLEVVVIHGVFKVWIDGTLVGTKSNNNMETETDAATYVSDPWYAAADVELRNFMYHDLDECSFQPTPAPTGELDAIASYTRIPR